jgi:hypothetical protein
MTPIFKLSKYLGKEDEASKIRHYLTQFERMFRVGIMIFDDYSHNSLVI